MGVETPVSSAADFAEAAQRDDTDGAGEENPSEATPAEDSSPRWSMSTSLEGGDAGTRNYEMGLPATGSV